MPQGQAARSDALAKGGHAHEAQTPAHKLHGGDVSCVGGGSWLVSSYAPRCLDDGWATRKGTRAGWVRADHLARRVHFDFDKSTIRPADARILDRDVKWLKANSDVKVAIDGGADQRGSMAYNQKLSERRARAVRDYLVARGIAADRIVEVGYGEKVLACRGAGAACWQKNRRADLLVKSTDKQSP